ncbi:MAG: AAA family ATPase [Lachnospiraceae bacterium]|nr:AAA family ATPase [Lachnospiraceae bacterium]
MNIQEAKKQIERAVRIYLEKDPYGNYRIPIKRQRPVFLLGAPGIGKTAIMEQIAEEMGLALVSYSMTHHTRQSALGLPFISHKNYGGTEFDVSEYTMSEIIASVYEMMERTGKKEGIFFLDEINCVSETLAPSMLQFLQYKTFGKHRVPEGWIVATAGNPPQFNRSVREFDVVTMDRMKVLEVEADYDTWRDYAVNRGIHGSVITYLDIKKNDFYLIENTVDGKSYVTARGWEDLSETIFLYEENEFEVDEILVGQYLRNRRICREFAAYYDLYQKYKKDYRVHQILSGKAGADVYSRAKQAGFDERLSLIGLLLDAIQMEIRDNIQIEDALRKQLLTLKEVKKDLEDLKQWDMESILRIFRSGWESLEARIACEDEAGSLGEIEKKELQMVIEVLHQDARAVHMRDVTRPKDVIDLISERFDGEVAQMKSVRAGISEKLSNLFQFVEKTFGAGNEMLVLVTDLTVNYNSAAFISRCGCSEYEKYNKKYQIYERQQEIEDAVQKLQI